jgi:hypothetical protein
VGEVLSLSKMWTRAVHKSKAGKDVLINGIRVKVHADWLSQPISLKGRTLDLEAACKQVPRKRADSLFSIICVENPANRKCECYEALALPFGATGSVFGFCRVARALHFILRKRFDVIACNYIDDFLIFEPDDLCETGLFITERVLELLGWRVAMSAKKRVAFEKALGTLGVIIDFSELDKGKFSVCNNPERVKGLIKTIDFHLKTGKIRHAAASSLRRKLLYAECQHLSRSGAMATRALGILRETSSKIESISGPIELSLMLIKFLLSTLPVREFEILVKEKPVLIFTDGAHEPNAVTRGATIFVPGELPVCFGEHVPSDLLATWRSNDTAQVIGQAELLPVLWAKWTWQEKIKKKRTLVFIDNDSARFALIRCYSPVPSSALSFVGTLSVLQCLFLVRLVLSSAIIFQLRG